MTSVHSTFATPTERLATYFDGAQPRAAFEDSDIDEIAILLEQCGHVASKCPRTYILCRTIGHLDTIEQLVKAGFTDQLFPVAEARSLPSFLGPSVKCAIIQRQEIILTKSLDLENGRHRHFAPQESLPFEILGRLGSGGYGQVDRILSKTSFKQYALKRIRRRAAFGNISSREALNGFLNEMKIIKSLDHRHIVEYIGSYTDKSYLGLVMSPVADTDLAAYNERLCGHLQADQPERTLSPFSMRDQPTTAELSSNLKTFYGCLTAALAYLHDHSIRHKDIKPQNILVARGNVLFSDFGLSRDFADDVGSTTSGITPASARYCAPEVANYEARNTSSDIWSLGCVFLEMTAALQGLNVEWIKTLFTNSNSQGTHFHSNPIALTELLRELKETVDPSHKRTFTWIEKMLLVNRNARPTAAQVLEMITCPETSDMDATPNMFCGICCVPGLESDSADSLADDLDVVTAIPLRKHHIKQDANTRHETFQPEVEAQKVRHLDSSEESLARARPNADSPFELMDSNPKAEAVRGAPNDTPSKIQAHSVTSKSRDANISSGNKISISPSIDVKSSDSPQREHTQQSAIFPQEEMSPSAVVSQSEELFEQSMDKGEPADLITMSREQKGVIGVPLSTSIEYASVYLKSMKTVGGMYLEGRIPTIVARCGEFFRHAV
ncbi:kinase-like domain-containing protein [Pyrenochaeta sp. MPI-SDFR-AT-0127]|nr:kinase-like domain-containing protein [Pyrenochaeta sp. MPI-SDFR-AT-0127]